jgi:hypothetical protein
LQSVKNRKNRGSEWLGTVNADKHERPSTGKLPRPSL